MDLNNGGIFYLKEACVETFAEAQSAERKGADIIELCARLDLDGLTPNLELSQKCISELAIPIKAMIRCREGNFVYNQSDLRIMRKQITDLKNIGVDQFVFGALTPENKIDLEAVKYISKSATDVCYTFHKAFDELLDWKEGIDQLKTVKNFTHVLTSGGEKTALAGLGNLKSIMKQSANHLTIIPAGKITVNNIESLHQQLKASHYHGRKIV